ncbi:potassium-transporting ATPase subunit KdpA [Polymorphobacter sp.]|uniref:potassium-transporting ATPase subunit KdpA n=1 Tax=Polymorphobacter sp. TaxID=1909290 RepID=UPI003F700A4B
MIEAVLLIIIVVGGTALLSWPLGRYLAWAMDPPAGDARAARVGGGLARLLGQGAVAGQGWRPYLGQLLAFNAAMFGFVFLILAVQQHLPLNPDGKGALSLDLIFNTAASFTTNTNLQHYSGEQQLSYLAQIGGLMWLQFVSAATGLAALVALARGLAGRTDMGNFFMDLARATFLVLVPVALVWAIGLALLGTPMTFAGAAQAVTLEGAQQIIARGPVAAFVAIKQLGTNGGGYFGPNSTHPFENVNFWTNILQMIAILLIPMACVWLFGRILGRIGHAKLVFGVMLGFLVVKVGLAVWAETAPNAAFAGLPITAEAGNLEGKELRFGTTTGPLWAVLTTATSNGSVGAMHDSLNPLAGLLPMVDMWLNATFGGIGVGMINMFLYLVVAVFLAGMLIGRTPAYLGHKVEAREVRLAILALLFHALFILGGTALFAATGLGAGTTFNPGPHGFSQILYEFTSSAANNGSGFEGLGDNTPAWNIATGLVMLFARFLPIVLPFAIVGAFMAKPRAAEGDGTLAPESSTFALMLGVTIIIFGALTFLPAAALGPIAEQLSAHAS